MQEDRWVKENRGIRNPHKKMQEYYEYLGIYFMKMEVFPVFKENNDSLIKGVRAAGHHL